jgi:N-methylhydantoinase A/oxoprolinase/acetone carboxylase beta subunit
VLRSEAGITIQSPQLDISTVAAGGGSRLFFRNGLFVVGPESAGAHPGPICYRYCAMRMPSFLDWRATRPIIPRRVR